MFLPFGLLTQDQREMFCKNLNKIRQDQIEKEKKIKELEECKKYLQNPPSSLSIKHMMVYSYVLQKYNKLKDEIDIKS